MPGNILSTDVMFPQFTGGETNDEKLSKVMDYLVMLQEQLRYTLANLGTENFNETEIETFGEMVAEPFMARIENQEGQIAEISATAEGLQTQVKDMSGAVSSLTQTVNGFNLSVTNQGTTSTIRLMSGLAQISSADIVMSGVVTFASLSGSGTSVINGDNITTGTLTGRNFNMIFDENAGVTKGEIRMYMYDVLDGSNGFYVGGLRLELLGQAPTNGSRANIVLSTDTLIGEAVGLRIQSTGITNITAPSIHLVGNVYVNGKLIS